MIKLIGTFALLTFTLSPFSCVKKEKSTTSKKLVIWEQEDARVAPFIDQTIEAFKALPENSEVQVRRVHYHTEDLTQQFQTSSIAGSPPDLIMSPSDTAGVFSVSGFILPTNDLFDLSKYNKAVVEAITLDGRAWGVPISNGNHLMLFYNKKLVKKVPETMDELFKYCATEVKKLKLRHCMAINLAEPFWLVPWLGAFGGWPIDNKTPTLDTPAMIKTLQFLKDLKYEKKYIPMECDYNCMDTLFKEAKVAFIINGDWSISTYAEHFKEDFGIALIPRLSETGNYPTPMVSGKYFMLSSKLSGEKLDLVRKFVEFYTNMENQVAQIRALKRLPALKAATSADFISKNPLLKASMDQILKGKPMPMATEMRAIWDAMRPHLGKTTTGKSTPEEAAKKMQLDALSKIKEMNQ